jgi:hypothetical protein
MAQVKDVKFEGTGSHSITLGRGYAIEREEVFLYFSGTWLGKTIRFNHKVDRYRCAGMTSITDGELSEWRNYVIDAHEVNEEGRRVSELSGTARSACYEATNSVVADWLLTDILAAKTAYRDSAAQALARAIQRLGTDRYQPWVAIRAALKVHRMRLSFGVEGALGDYAKALELVSTANEDITETLANEKAEFNPYTWSSNGKVDA